MAKSREIKMPLPTADDLFSTQEQRDEAKRETVMDIPLEKISDFPNHPFKVKMDESMGEMIESIRQYGVLVPALVRESQRAVMKWWQDTGEGWQVNWLKSRQSLV